MTGGGTKKGTSNEADAKKGSQPRTSARARLRPKAQLTLPDPIRQALRVSVGDEVEFVVHEDGVITVRGYVSVPSDQVWHFKSGQPDELSTTAQSRK